MCKSCRTNNRTMGKISHGHFAQDIPDPARPKGFRQPKKRKVIRQKLILTPEEIQRLIDAVPGSEKV